MKLIIPFFLFQLITISIFGQTETDSTSISFSDREINKKVSILTTNGEDIPLPDTLNLNNILRELGVDKAQRERALSVLQNLSSAENDTLFVYGQSGQRIQIIAKGSAAAATMNAQQNKSESDKDWEEWEDWDDWDHSHDGSSSKSYSRFFSKSDFGFYLGITNFTNSKPSSPYQQYELRTWNSFYIAFSFRKNSTVYQSKNMDLAISYGPEIAWANFTFQNSNAARYNDGQVSFEYAGFSTKKSKLVMPYINLPVMLNMGFKNDNFLIGLGGYLGYRIGAHTKIKGTSGNKAKIKSSYGLNDLIYGVTTEIGQKNGLKVFFRYDLHKLFKENQINAKDLGAFSVGLRI